MAAFVKGDIVVVPFPLSAATGSKRRPGVVVASWPFGTGTDYLLSLISSQPDASPTTIQLKTADILNGSLKVKSYIRAPYLFAADDALISYRVGNLTPQKLDQLKQVLISLIT